VCGVGGCLACCSGLFDLELGSGPLFVVFVCVARLLIFVSLRGVDGVHLWFIQKVLYSRVGSGHVLRDPGSLWRGSLFVRFCLLVLLFLQPVLFVICLLCRLLVVICWIRFLEA
jgi:hypothetical protein